MHKPENWLEAFDTKIHSQRGEDGRIQKILDVIGQQNKWCVEFGAWDGLYNSNVLNLIKNHDYSAVLIEGSSEKFAELKKNMADYKVTPVNAFVGFDPRDGLDKILESTPIPKDFDVLVIDIDGNDYHTWKAVEKYRPKLVVIEYNPTIPSEVDFVQEPDPSVNHGASLLALIRLGKEKGYELVSANLNNGFFVRKEDFPKFGIQDNSIYKLRTDLSRVTYIFSGYDGQVLLSGYKKLDLHGMPFQEARMQLIPKFLRGYDDAANGLGKLRRLVRKNYKSLRKRGWL